MQLEKLNLNDGVAVSSDSKQIYILDDDESVRRALKFLMISYGFFVDTFASSEEFFSSVSNENAGYLILDIHLVGENGWDTMKRLKETGSTRPVIVITADRKEGVREKALSEGAVGFLQKPFEASYMLHLVNQTFN